MSSSVLRSVTGCKSLSTSYCRQKPGSSSIFLFHGIRTTTLELLMKCHWRKSIQHDCELKLRRTTINIQFVMLSFRSSQFVSCEVSLKRTHDKKRNPNRSQKIQQKLPGKTVQKRYNHKKHTIFRRFLILCSHDILINSAAFEKQKNTVA